MSLSLSPEMLQDLLEKTKMLKKQELTNPNSCMSRANDDEMTFVLLARDEAGPATIRFWIQERIRLGKNTMYDAQIISAEECADEMEKQRARKSK